MSGAEPNLITKFKPAIHLTQLLRIKIFPLLVRAVTNKGSFSLFDQMVASATNFFTGIIIARSCTKEELGLYMLGFSIILFLNELQTSLISAPYMIYSQRLSGKQHNLYFGSSLVHQLLLSILIVLALFFGNLAIISNGFGSISVIPVLRALVLFVFFIMLREFIRRICFAGLMMRTALIVDCIVAAIQLSSLLLLAHLNILSAENTFYCVGTGCAIASLGWLFFKRGSYTFSKSHIFPDLRKNLSFGKWIFASGLLWATSMTLYPWLLAFFHGSAATGTWTACWGIIAVANPLVLGIQNLLGPKIIQSHTNDGIIGLRNFTAKMTGFYLLIITPLAIGLFFFGGQLVVLFYGEKYLGNGHIVSLLSINLLVVAASFTLSRALLAMEKTKVYFLANIIPLIVMLTAGIILVKYLGPLGVAWGVLLGTFTTAAMMVFLFVGLIRKNNND